MIKKFIRVLSNKYPLILKALTLLNILTLPQKLYIDYHIKKGSIPQLNGDKEVFIVSLTSHKNRVAGTLPYTLWTLLNQSRKPDKIIVWLDETKWNANNIPSKLKVLEKGGVEFNFCKDIGSYTKLVPALRAFPNCVIITADDDLYYPKNWLKQLAGAYANDPKKIQIHRAHEIVGKISSTEIAPYSDWKHAVKKTLHPERLFLTGVGGVLYPPNSLGKEGTNEEVFLLLSPKGDDIWFWACAKANGTEFSLVKNGYRKLKYINIADELSGLTVENVVNNRNDTQIKAVIGYFSLKNSFGG
ncbi:glycosyl transferase [Fibrobacterales bacterium]|nr:glycosyl transferase [Fibrobacterales bacterium]